MNSLNNINLDVTKYSNIELKEILGLNDIHQGEQINEHIDLISKTVSNDFNLLFSTKNKIITFLNSVKSKLVNNNIDIIPESNLDITFASSQNHMISNSPASNPLIHNPNTLGGVNAVINEGRGEYYPPGYINPINYRTFKKTINIDSKFRNAYYNTKSSDFHLDLPETFKKVVNMKLISYEIPLSIYNINKSNNCFTIVDNSSGQVYTIDISFGSYLTIFDTRYTESTQESILDIAEQIEKQEPFLSNDELKFRVEGWNGRSYIVYDASDTSVSYTVLFNRDCCGNEDVETPLPLKLGWLLGFRFGSYTLDSNANRIIESEGIINLTVPKYLYLSINDYNHAANNNFVVAFSDSTFSENIIARIEYGFHLQKNGYFNTGFLYETENYSRSYYGPVDIKKLHIKLVDEYGRVVDLNNMDWSILLQLDVLYD